MVWSRQNSHFLAVRSLLVTVTSYTREQIISCLVLHYCNCLHVEINGEVSVNCVLILIYDDINVYRFIAEVVCYEYKNTLL